MQSEYLRQVPPQIWPHCASVGNGHGQQTWCCRRLFGILFTSTVPRRSRTEAKYNKHNTLGFDSRQLSTNYFGTSKANCALPEGDVKRETFLRFYHRPCACCMGPCVCIICGCCACCCCGIIPESLEASLRPDEEAKLSRRAPTRPNVFQQCTRTNGPWSNATTRSAPTDRGTRCEPRVQVRLRVGEGRTHVVSLCNKTQVSFL